MAMGSLPSIIFLVPIFFIIPVNCGKGLKFWSSKPSYRQLPPAPESSYGTRPQPDPLGQPAQANPNDIVRATAATLLITLADWIAESRQQFDKKNYQYITSKFNNYSQNLAVISKHNKDQVLSVCENYINDEKMDLRDAANFIKKNWNGLEKLARAAGYNYD